jgi:hypothetical protein
VVEGVKRERISVVRARIPSIVWLELLGCFDEDGCMLDLNVLGYFGGLFVLWGTIFVAFVLFDVVCLVLRCLWIRGCRRVHLEVQLVEFAD